MMLYEKTDLPLSTPGYVFRVTFAMTMLVILFTQYSLKQWIAIIFTGIIGVISYKITGNNDLIRIGMFVCACKSADIEKLLRYICVFSTVGFSMIFVASVSGIYGNLYLQGDFGRSDKHELRYVFGFGHPNTVHGSFFAVALLILYLTRKLDRNIKLGICVVLLSLNWILGDYTGSRTGVMAATFAIFLAVIAMHLDKKKKFKFPYIFGAAFLAFSVFISILAAAVSPYVGDKLGDGNEFLWKLNRRVTGRIWTLYADSQLHKGSLESWRLFGDRYSGEYFFDMGWVRVFYWYGIIPAILIIALFFILIYDLYKRQNLDMLIMVTAISAYTIVEAGFVSSYIGRNYMLPVLGVYLLGGLTCREKTSI
ncbi:MAG: hypothetical protein E7302_00375 [Butyrivibrio sp.]|nr:hypothetical protein [Butyrivibrio sp.]